MSDTEASRLVSEALKFHRIRGHERRSLVRDLAEDSASAAQLAEKYGKAEIAIKKFSQYNRAEILEVRREINAGVTGCGLPTQDGSNGHASAHC